MLLSHNAMTLTAALGNVVYDCYIKKLSEPQILQLFTCPCNFRTALMFNNLESDRDEMCKCLTPDFIERDKLDQAQW